MIYFFINILQGDMKLLESKLPRGSYCFFQVQSGSTRYYGMIKKEAYPLFTASLSAELQQLVEVLDKTVFQHFFLQNIGDQVYFTGNKRLMVHLSDGYE